MKLIGKAYPNSSYQARFRAVDMSVFARLLMRHLGPLISLTTITVGCSLPETDIDKMTAQSIFPDRRIAALSLAAENGNVEKVDALVKSGVDVNSIGRYNVTPLLRAMVARNKDGYKALLRHGANPNLLNSRGFAVLNTAALEADPFWLREALGHGGNPNLVNDGNTFFPGQTPLYYAISKSRLANVKLLITAKADVNHKDRTKSCPLLRAAQRPAYDIVFVLLEAGADFRQKDAADDDLVEWVSRRNGENLPDDDQKRWFGKTVEFLKQKGAKFKLPKD